MRAPQKINSYVVIDFETGGLDKKNGCHSQVVPVTEFAGLAIDGVTLQEIVRYDNLVKPYDSNLYYDPQAATATGITKQMCEKEGVVLEQLVVEICQLLEEANIHKSKVARPIFVAHNWPFDRQFIQDIFRRAKVDLSKYVAGAKDAFGNFIPAGIDSIDLAKGCWAEITDTTTKFNLGACCNKAGTDVIDGHRAMNDVIPLTDLLRYFLTRLRSGSSEVTINEGQISIHRQGFQW